MAPWDEPFHHRHHHHRHHHSPNRPFIEVDIVSPFARPPPPPRFTSEVIIAPQPAPAEIIYVTPQQPRPPPPRVTEVIYAPQPRPAEVVYVPQPQPEHWDNRPRW